MLNTHYNTAQHLGAGSFTPGGSYSGCVKKLVFLAIGFVSNPLIGY